jgi:hypothetical protein
MPTLASLTDPLADDLGPLAPPPISKIFQRQRSGSAPSPIKVDRDSKDIYSYNITVTPRPTSSIDSTPTTAESGEYANQTFPETPNAFSPTYTWTSDGWGNGSPGMAPSSSTAEHFGMSPVPQTPMAAGMAMAQRSFSVKSTKSQQALIQRAASTVRGARVSRSASVGVRQRPSLAESFVPGAEEPLEEKDETTESLSDEIRHPYAAAADDLSPNSSNTPVESTFEGKASQSTTSVATGSIGTSKSGMSSQKSLTTKDKDLPDLPPQSPPSIPLSSSSVVSLPEVTHTPPPAPPEHYSPPHRPPPLLSESLTTPIVPPASAQSLPEFSSPSDSNSLLHHPQVPLLSSSAPASQLQTPTPAITPTSSEGGHVIIPPATPPMLIATPPHALPPSPHSAPAITENDTQAVYSGLPPAYDTLYDQSPFDNRLPVESATPSTSRSVFDPNYALSPGYSPSTPSMSDRRGISRGTATSSSRRQRTRPPLPAGPRRPSHHAEHSRARNASVSSVNSSGTALANPQNTVPSNANVAPLPSPRFQTPPMRWRGYTMDAAKWTFSSAQLQNIVSRAIKQSAEASSIRLLRLETLDQELPDEIHKLEMQRTDVTTRYKMLTRRRGDLYRALSAQLGGLKPDDMQNALKTVDDLREISTAQDRLAEELHSADEQLAQLASLRDVHSASALAMALRKLNASFLKQVSENQTLRSQLASMEAERDEAWKHAEAVANEYDVLQQKLDVATSSNRSSRVTASRKSSIRVSKAGLRSVRSSMSSNHRISGVPSTARSTFSIEDVPPVPQLPHRRPGDIRTDLPSMSSAVSLNHAFVFHS